MNKSEIEDVIGIRSEDIMDNVISEDIVYVVFINENQVACRIQGRPEALGFDFKLGAYDKYVKLEKAESQFSINTIDGEKVYTLIKQ